MNFFIYAPFFVLFVYAAFDFVGRMASLWNRSKVSDSPEPIQLKLDQDEKLELPTAIAPMTIGEPVELTVVVPEKKKDLIQFIKDHELQSKVYALTGATYSNSKVNKLPVLRRAVEMAIA